MAELKETKTKTSTLKDEISIIVAADPLNPDDKMVHCGINGQFWEFERGKEVIVPKQVAVVLREAGYPVSTTF